MKNSKIPNSIQKQTIPKSYWRIRQQHSTHSLSLSINSFIHWDFDGSISTPSSAFSATFPKPDSWVCWALSPSAAAMAGSQVLVVFKQADGKLGVKTYNITGYAPLNESKVWFDIKDSSAEASTGDAIMLFSMIVLPEKGTTVLNHVWQVGPSITGGIPDRHEFQPPVNLNAKGSLNLLRREKSISRIFLSLSKQQCRCISISMATTIWFISSVSHHYQTFSKTEQT